MPAQVKTAREQEKVKSLRLSLVTAVLGGLTLFPLFFWISHLRVLGRGPTALAVSSVQARNVAVLFPLLQASGLASLAWSYISVLLGLLVSGEGLSWLPLHRSTITRLHRQVSLLVTALVLVHAASAIAFGAVGDNFVATFVPQALRGEAASGYDLGIAAFYGALLLGPTYYLRTTQLEVRIWRFAHLFAVVVYILSVWHTLILGLGIAYFPWGRPFLWALQLPLLLLFGYRVMRPFGTRNLVPDEARNRVTLIRYGLAALAGLAVIAIAVILFTGNADFVTVI